MNGQSKTRTRQERIESLGIPKPRLVQWWNDSDKADWAVRIVIGITAAIALLVICRSWEPRFPFRSNTILPRDVIARVDFEVENKTRTEALQLEKIREVPVFYRNRPAPLDELSAQLKNRLFVVRNSASLKEMTDEQKSKFDEFSPSEPVNPETASETESSPVKRFNAIKSVLGDDRGLENLDTAFRTLTTTVFKNGLLHGLQHEPEQGSQHVIRVYATQPDESVHVNVDDVQIALMRPKIEKTLAEEFRRLFDGAADADEARLVAQMISEWIDSRLQECITLAYDDEASERSRAEIASGVQTVMEKYYAGQSELARAGEPLNDDELRLLREEHSSWVANRSSIDRMARFAAYAGMLAAVSLLCGCYIVFVDDRSLVMERHKLLKLLTLFVSAVGISYWVSTDQYRAELAPLAVASIIASIVYGRDLGMLLMAAACLSVTLFMNESLSHLVMLAATCTSCTLLTGRIRTHSHLLVVGGSSAAVTVLTIVGVGFVTSDTMSSSQLPEAAVDVIGTTPMTFQALLVSLVQEGLRAGAFIVISAAALTPILPFIEKAFGVQTDLSLLSLSDASHPLLRRLAQRAPGTYNHSINVASIAEAAAESIGANGLLVRVGAYFHDIGKMFKPEYFIENQSGVNQHDSLQPAMSTLSDHCARQRRRRLGSQSPPASAADRSDHAAPRHHARGVFLQRGGEAKRRESRTRKQVSDKDFRYPGPKPQTLEAAVMMLADTVESASRTLVDPTPAQDPESWSTRLPRKKWGTGNSMNAG